MPTDSRERHSLKSLMDPGSNSGKGGISLDDYLVKSKRRLDEITDLVSMGEPASRVSRDWMLAQVDFIVETIGDESLELADGVRSDLLQLLLAIANLNEQMRHQASLSL